MNLRRLLPFLLFFPLLGFGQRSAEIGITAGEMWYNGELNPGRQFYNMNPGGGIVFRHNFNMRYSLRITGIYGHVAGSDPDYGDPFQSQRGLYFTSPVTELAAVTEFNFLPYEIGDSKYRFTPYVFGGFALFKMNPRLGGAGSQELRGLLNEPGKKYSVIQPAIPFGMGFKLSIFRRLGMFLEWGMRKTYTDYLDDVSTTWAGALSTAGGTEYIAHPLGGFQRGYEKKKDWYSYAGVGLVYLLKKKKPCPGILN